MKVSDQTTTKSNLQSRRNFPRLKVSCSPEEKIEIEANAKKANLSVSSYLRFLGLNYRIVAPVDLERVDDLLRINGDLGRLGGLLKLWLTKDGVRKKFGSDYISALLVKIEETQGDMLLLLKDIRRKHSK
ncbi:conjugal transfer protein TraJ [Acetobacteraceae bacterium]|nr:conjugal transfer protein TraJ [Acetobacteraceae bacterium]